MQEEDRRKLTANCDRLVKEIDWDKILPKLIENGIYREGDKKVERWRKDLTNMDNNREIYLTISRRGPQAFEKFRKCLKQIGRNDLANVLNPDSNSDDEVDNILNNAGILDQVIQNGNINNNLERSHVREEEATQVEENDDYYTKLQSTHTPLAIRVKKSTKFMDRRTAKVPCYVMQSKPRGLVLIINNTSFGGVEEERSAAEHDETNLKDLFEQMGFKVQTSGNLTRQEMLDRFEKFSKQPELRHVSSMFVIVMSHGNEYVIDNRSHSVVSGVDNLYITDIEILDIFTTIACENMYNKPKVFIFQTCRGEKIQRPICASNVSMGRDDTDVNRFVSAIEPRLLSTRNMSDMLVAYSTLPGHKANRDILTGSWYIQTLCEVMMNHAHDTELYDMLQMADQRLTGLRSQRFGCQTSNIWNVGFNKKCYLNPGYFGNP